MPNGNDQFEMGIASCNRPYAEHLFVFVQEFGMPQSTWDGIPKALITNV